MSRVTAVLSRAIAVVLCAIAATPASAAPSDDAATETWVSSIPLQTDLKLTSVLRSPQGERDNLVVVEQATAEGVTYRWRAVQVSASGQREQASFSRFVRAADLARAARLHTVYWSVDRTDYPGYTTWSISSAAYDQLRATGHAPFLVVDKAESGGAGVALRNTLKLKGALSVVGAKPEPFPLLVNGKRVRVPALRLHGDFVFQEQRRTLEFWVLADSAHPLLLKSVNGDNVLQIVRVDLPQRAIPVAVSGAPQQGEPKRSGGIEGAFEGIESALDTDCRFELPGVYFEFATADLAPESDPAIASLAQLLRKHPDWQLAVEGHTDNIGTDADNLKLSQARAKAVRRRLVEQHAVDPQRLGTAGYGEARPRESNSTIEGRARNRRVELVRACAPSSSGAPQ